MATLLRQIISSGAPPSLARLPMTPEQVAASYGEREGEAGNDASAVSPEPEDPGSRRGPQQPAAGAAHPD
jgi:hypothetical protein